MDKASLLTKKLEIITEGAKKEYKIIRECFIGAFLFGSQNYGLEVKDSDIDCLIVLNCKTTVNIPRMIQNEFGGKCFLYSVSNFLDTVEQRDLRSLEALFGPYQIIDHKYVDLFENFKASYVKFITFASLAYSFYNKCSEHVMNINSHKKGSYYYNKRLYWAIRIVDQIEQLKDNKKSFIDCFHYINVFNFNFDLRDLKTGDYLLSAEELIKLDSIFDTYLRLVREQGYYKPVKKELELISNLRIAIALLAPDERLLK